MLYMHLKKHSIQLGVAYVYVLNQLTYLQQKHGVYCKEFVEWATLQ